MRTTVEGPARHGGRIQAVDVARAVALIGMMAVHTLPRLDEDGTVSLAYQVAGGRSSALFAVLAGVGLALATGGQQAPHGRRRARMSVSLVVRAGVVAAVGVALGTLPDNRVAVILVYYAAMFVLALPFLGLAWRALAGWALGTAVVVPLVSHWWREDLAPASFTSPSTEWFAWPVSEALTEIGVTGVYPALPWMSYIFAGMAIGRTSLSRRVAGLLLGGGAALALGCRVLSELLLANGGREAIEAAGGDRFGRPLDVALEGGLFGVTPTSTPWWLAVASPHASTPLDLLGTIGSSSAVLGLCLLLVRGQWWWLPLRSAGSMPLTLYTAHVVLLATVLDRDVPGVLWWHVVVLLGAATWWRGVVGRGPLEYGTRLLGNATADLLLPHRPPSAAATDPGAGTGHARASTGHARAGTGGAAKAESPSGGDPGAALGDGATTAAQRGAQHEQPRQDTREGDQQQ